MPYMKKLLFILMVLSSTLTLSQDPFFYNSNTLQLYNNPAFTGLIKSFSMDFGYRNQWPELSGNYVTSITSVNQFLGKGHGVSMQVMTDNAANTIQKVEIDLSYAKSFKLVDGHYLSGGIQFAYFQKNLDVSKLTFGDMIDPRTGFIYPAQTLNVRTPISNVDLSAGLVYYNEFGYVSFSTKHLMEPNESFFVGEESNLPRLYFAELGGKIQLNDFRFVPYVRYRYQNSFSSSQVGMKAMFKSWFVEGGWQPNSGFYSGAGYLGEHIKVGYNLVGYSSFGDYYFAHEVFLGCNLKLFKKENEHFFDF